MRKSTLAFPLWVFALLTIGALTSTAKAQFCWYCDVPPTGPAQCNPSDSAGSLSCWETPQYCATRFDQPCNTNNPPPQSPNKTPKLATKPCSPLVQEGVKLSYTEAELRKVANQSPRFAVILDDMVKNGTLIQVKASWSAKWVPMDVTMAYFESRLKSNKSEKAEHIPPRVEGPITEVKMTVVTGKIQMEILSGSRPGELKKLSIPLKLER